MLARWLVLICAAMAVQLVAVGCSSSATLAVNPGLKDDRGADRLHHALARGAAQSGKASWYGAKFHGRLTANGEVYDMNGVSAAHKTLPFGTIVRVTNLDNGRKLDVRINDRGPFIRGRILDLSRGAAAEIGLIGPGVARIELTVVTWPDSRKPDTKSARKRSTGAESSTRNAASAPTQDGLWVQAGAFKERKRADTQAHDLKQFDDRFQVYRGGGWYRVQARLDHADEARELLESLRASGVDAVLREP